MEHTRPPGTFCFMGELEYNQIQELQIQAWWWNLFEHFDLSCRMVPFFWYDCEKGFCKCAVFYGMSWYPCLFHSISMYVCFFPCNLIWVGWLRLESLTILRRERESTSFWAWDSLPYEVCLGQVPIAGKRVQFQGVTRQNQLIFAHGRWSHQKRNPCWRLIRFFPVGLRGGLWSCNGTRGLDLYIYTVVILTMYIYLVLLRKISIIWYQYICKIYNVYPCLVVGTYHSYQLVAGTFETFIEIGDWGRDNSWCERWVRLSEKLLHPFGNNME